MLGNNLCTGCGEKLRNKIDKGVYYCLNDCEQEHSTTEGYRLQIYHGVPVEIDLTIPEECRLATMTTSMLFKDYFYSARISKYPYWRLIRKGVDIEIQAKEDMTQNYIYRDAWRGLLRE